MGWKAIEGYKYPYRISDTAKVQKFYNGKWVDVATSFHKSTRRVEMYLRKVDGKLVIVPLTLLMANAFLGGRKPGYKIVHKNGMKTDCEVENLAFATPEEIGKKYGHLARRKPVLKLDKAGKLLAVYPSSREAAKDNFMCESQVKKHCRGILKNPFKFNDFTFVYDS